MGQLSLPQRYFRFLELKKLWQTNQEKTTSYWFLQFDIDLTNGLGVQGYENV